MYMDSLLVQSKNKEKKTKQNKVVTSPDGSGNETCGNMFGKGGIPGKWNDLPCSLPAKYLKYPPVILC